MEQPSQSPNDVKIWRDLKIQNQKTDLAMNPKSRLLSQTLQPPRHRTRWSLRSPEKDAPCAQSIRRRNKPIQEDHKHIRGEEKRWETAKRRKDKGERLLQRWHAHGRATSRRREEQNAWDLLYREREECLVLFLIQIYRHIYLSIS